MFDRMPVRVPRRAGTGPAPTTTGAGTGPASTTTGAGTGSASTTAGVLFLVLMLACGLIPPLGSTPVRAQDAATPTPVETSSGSDGPLAAWTQISIDGTLQARAVVDGDCPEMIVDGDVALMSVRAERSDAFPVVVCEAAIPGGAATVQIGSAQLPAIEPHPRRVISIGDTGCRIAEEWQQDCNDPVAWPFARVAEQATAWSPDMVIHTGDYLYREVSCPDDAEGCVGSPYGDAFDRYRLRSSMIRSETRRPETMQVGIPVPGCVLAPTKYRFW